MLPRFKELSTAILLLREHKSRTVRAALIELLPTLARFCPDAFGRAYLDDSLDFLVKSARIAELRSDALVALGKLCLVQI